MFFSHLDKESNWVWSGPGPFKETIPDFGWLERPIPSAEENCLTWSITITNRRRGKHSYSYFSAVFLSYHTTSFKCLFIIYSRYH